MTPLSPSDANLAMLQLDQQRMIQKKLDMDALRERLHNKPGQQAKLREACEGFESLFIQKLWEQMRKNVQKSGYLHSRDEQTYQGMYDVEFSKKMTAAGGIGLADMLYEQLSQRLGQSSLTTSPRNDPRLPIIPAGSSVTALSSSPVSLPAALEDKARLDGIPLDNKKIRPLYEDAPASSPSAAPASVAPTAPQPQAEVDAPAALSPEEAALLEAALRQNMAEAGRISEERAPGPAGARFGTTFATEPANPAESAAVSHTNNLPRS